MIQLAVCPHRPGLPRVRQSQRTARRQHQYIMMNMPPPLPGSLSADVSYLAVGFSGILFMENNWYLNTMQFGVGVIYRAFKLMALFVYLWGVQICEQCPGWPGASSCPSNANNTHSLSPCPTLDDLHVNRYLSRACAAPPRTLTHIRTHQSSEFTDAHQRTCWLAALHFHFQETSVLRKKTNGFLFKCYPQKRKYPSRTPHDDFPSKVSS